MTERAKRPVLGLSKLVATAAWSWCTARSLRSHVALDLAEHVLDAACSCWLAASCAGAAQQGAGAGAQHVGAGAASQHVGAAGAQQLFRLRNLLNKPNLPPLPQLVAGSQQVGAGAGSQHTG
jgi:hypothetical protein